MCERADQICMDLINGVASQLCAEWWANFILKYSCDSQTARDGIWIIWIRNKLYVQNSMSNRLFIYIVLWIAAFWCRKSPLRVFFKVLQSECESQGIHFNELPSSCANLRGSSPTTAQEKKDKVALLCVKFWLLKYFLGLLFPQPCRKTQSEKRFYTCVILAFLTRCWADRLNRLTED